MGMTATGIGGIIVISLHIVVLAAMCCFMHRALMDKSSTLLCCVGTCDSLQACLLLAALVLIIISLVEAKGAGIAGAVIVIVSVLVQFLLLGYLVFGACKLGSSMDRMTPAAWTGIK